METINRECESSFYVFDIGELKNRISYLRENLPPYTELCYAVKANPFISKEIENDVERFEICSPGEAEICKAIGIDSSKMVISGIYKTPSFIEALVADDSFKGIFTIESLNQYELLLSLSEKYGRELEVLPRLTNDSQFGMDESDVEMIVSRRSTNRLNVMGIQYFSGTQKTSLKKYQRELEYLSGFLGRLREEYSFEARELEYGTGFPVSYFAGDKLDEPALLKGFSEILDGLPHKPRIILELGRSIAASCGKYYTHIVDIKKNKGHSYALTDGGMHHIVYYGQYMAMKQPFVSVVGKDETVENVQWTVCGSLCSMNDIIVKQITLPDIKVGDILRFENAGAYCMTEGISLLLSRDLPAIYLVRGNGELFRLRKPFETKLLNMPEYEKV
ncbi:MAG: alanine racemase [Clostridia bacterium]|nr:alanine racemase [Clostridia bacterium]